jgi:APA family basic amino acid/polyamine antiporter
MVVGTMIGSGVFLLPSVLAPYGSLSLAGWAVTATGTLFIAFSLGSLARRLPRIGGPYAYVREAFGDLPAFLIAWGYWTSLWTGMSAVAVAFAGYVSVFLPSMKDRPEGEAAIALAIVWVLTAINLAGVRTAAVVQLVTTVLKILPLLAIGAAGLLYSERVPLTATNPDNQPIVLVVATLAMITMWAFLGIEAVTIPAEDVIDARRTIPRALVTGLFTVTLVYVLATTGVMAVIPASELVSASSPFADAASRLVGSWGAYLIAAGALVAIAGALNALVLLAGQTLLAASRDGLFPSRFRKLNARGVPTAALILSGALSTVFILTNYASGLVAAFTTMILLSTLTCIAPYAASAAADLVLQWRDRAAGSQIRPGSVAIAAIALLFSIFAIIGSGTKVVVYGLLLLSAGLPVYYWVKRIQEVSE